MRLWMLLSGALFLALVGSALWWLMHDRLPARHVDASASHFHAHDDETARLHLVVQTVGARESIHASWERDVAGDLVVRLRTRPRRDAEPEHEGEVTLDLMVPRARRARIYDLRWSHPNEHPEGFDLELDSRKP